MMMVMMTITVMMMMIVMLLTNTLLLLLHLLLLLLLYLAIDLLDQHVDVLYNCLKNIREKQYMSEGILREQTLAFTSSLSISKLKPLIPTAATTTTTTTIAATTTTTHAAAASSSSSAAAAAALSSTTTTTTTPSTTTPASTTIPPSQAQTNHQEVMMPPSSSTSSTSSSTSLSSLPLRPHHYHTTDLPDLKEILYNNKLRVVEAHLFTTIVDSLSSSSAGELTKTLSCMLLKCLKPLHLYCWNV